MLLEEFLGHVLANNASTFASMTRMGILLVLENRVPGPIKVAYVMVTRATTKTASAVFKALIPGWNCT
jgi:hypothetical protein